MLLKDNPFYVLDVQLSSNRRKIAEAAEEMGFVLGSDKCSEAQSILTNPAKRLQAELSWFLEADENEIASIRPSISDNCLISINSLNGYAKLNALIHNLTISEYSSIYELGFDIISIDEQYSSINIKETVEVLNKARSAAGLSSVSESEVQECHRTVVEDIRKLLNEKVKHYDEKTYIDFVTRIAEKYIANKQCDAGPVLYDIVDQYEIRMQSEIENKSNQIKQYIDLIKSEQSNDTISASVPKLIERVKDWDVYAQPLQLRSQASGMPHEASQELADELRFLCLFLHNEKQLTSEAKSLASEMQSVFLELGTINEIFTNDTKKLEEIENDKRNAQIIQTIEEEFKGIETTVNSFGLLKGVRNFDNLKNRVTNLNKKIKDSHLPYETQNQLRSALCFMVRKAAIDLNNMYQDPAAAYRIIKDLYPIFIDLPEPKKKLAEDMATLERNPASYYTPTSVQTSARTLEKAQSSSNKKWIIGLIAVVLIIIIAVSSNNSKPTTKSSYGTSSSYSSSTTKETKKPTTTTTTKPATKSEKKYTSAASVGDNVYTSVVLIEPKHGIYYSEVGKAVKAFTRYDTFVCKCTTDDGKTVWVSFSASDYRNKIDSTIDTYVTTSTGGFNGEIVRFSPAAKIHGKVVKATNVMNGLDKDIGQTSLVQYSSIDIPKQNINVQATISIKKITPMYTITSGYSDTVTHVLCEYTDTNGKKNWLYLSVSEYRKNFDSSYKSNSSAKTKSFTTAKKVSVTSQYADDLITNASSTIGQKTLYVFSGLK